MVTGCKYTFQRLSGESVRFSVDFHHFITTQLNQKEIFFASEAVLESG